MTNAQILRELQLTHKLLSANADKAIDKSFEIGGVDVDTKTKIEAAWLQGAYQAYRVSLDEVFSIITRLQTAMDEEAGSVTSSI